MYCTVEFWFGVVADGYSIYYVVEFLWYALSVPLPSLLWRKRRRSE